MPAPRIAILTPCYNEEEALPAYIEAVERVLLARTDVDYQVILIDDGSSDRTWELIQAASARSSRYRAIRLSRNFGAHAAESAGFDLVEADATVTLAADLQDPPETICEFVDAWRRGAQVVWGERISRGDSRLRTLSSIVFLAIIRRFAMPRHSKVVTGGFLLLDRKVVQCIRAMREQNRVTFGLVAWTGFNQEVVPYHRRQRVAGKSTWTVARLLRSMYDTFIGFSQVLPRTITAFGLIWSFVGFVAALVLILEVFIDPPRVSGWASLMIALMLFSGITFLILGVMSEYLARIYFESTRRPLYFVAADSASDTVKQHDAP